MTINGQDHVNQSILDTATANQLYAQRSNDYLSQRGMHAQAQQLAGLAQPARPTLHIEGVPGGFIVTQAGQGRQVASTVAAVARILREWAKAQEPQEG